MDKLLPYLTRFAVALVIFVIGYVLIKLLDIAIRKGFAFQESLSNLAAGMMIALNNPFNIGDYIKIIVR